MKYYEEDLFIVAFTLHNGVAQIDDRFNEFDKFTQFCDELKTAEVDGDVAKIDSLLELYPDFRDKSIKSNAKYRYCYNAYLAYLYQIGLSSDAFGYNYERDIKKRQIIT